MRGVFIVLFLVGVIGAFGVYNFEEHNSPEVYYEGDVIFNTEEQYVKFKQYMIDPTVKKIEVQVLSSSPPIWVDYSIRVPRSYNPPPAQFDSSGGHHRIWIMLIGSSLGALAFTSLILVLVWKEDDGT